MDPASTPLVPKPATPPAHRPNQLAIAFGRCLQRSLFQIGLIAASLCAGGYGGFKLATSVPPDPVDAGLAMLGVLTLSLTLIVRHGPYNLVGQLETAMESMQSTSFELKGSTSALQCQVKRLEAENKALTHTREKMHDELEQSALVRRGMQQTLTTLLTDVGTRNTELEALTTAVADEVQQLGEASAESTNQFMQAITGVAEQMQRADRLASRLSTVSRSNTELSRKMVMITHKLEESLNELQDAQFADRMQSLLLKLDALGDDGLRDRLAGGIALRADESAALAALLSQLDQDLRDELTLKTERCTQLATASRKVVDDSLGAVFID
jgi:chromosome segregation ATPase